MVVIFDPYGALMFNGNRVLIVFYLIFCCSKLKLFTILIANIARLARFAIITFWFKTLLKFSLYILSLYIIYDLITITGCRKHELGTINMLYSLKKVCHITPLPPHNGPRPLHNDYFLLSPRWPLWRGLTVLLGQRKIVLFTMTSFCRGSLYRSWNSTDILHFSNYFRWRRRSNIVHDWKETTPKNRAHI